jgi:hypothetical protein
VVFLELQVAAVRLARRQLLQLPQVALAVLALEIGLRVAVAAQVVQQVVLAALVQRVLVTLRVVAVAELLAHLVALAVMALTVMLVSTLGKELT